MMRKENTSNNNLIIASMAMLIIILCSYSKLIAQDSGIFEINTLPKKGILLDKGWKFRTGDNPDFAKPDFDDSAWSPINPNLDIRNFPDSVKAGICWLRLHVVLDNRLQEEQLALWIHQYIASEIYLNGKLKKLWPIILWHYQLRSQLSGLLNKCWQCVMQFNQWPIYILMDPLSFRS